MMGDGGLGLLIVTLVCIGVYVLGLFLYLRYKRPKPADDD